MCRKVETDPFGSKILLSSSNQFHWAPFGPLEWLDLMSDGLAGHEIDFDRIVRDSPWLVSTKVYPTLVETGWFRLPMAPTILV